MSSHIFALGLGAQDDVAIIVKPGQIGDDCPVSGSDVAQVVTLLDTIPMAHKVALRDIAAGEQIHKFGQPIGVATSAIRKGEHVHVHNMTGLRQGLRGEQA